MNQISDNLVVLGGDMGQAKVVDTETPKWYVLHYMFGTAPVFMHTTSINVDLVIQTVKEYCLSTSVTKYVGYQLLGISGDKQTEDWLECFGYYNEVDLTWKVEVQLPDQPSPMFVFETKNRDALQDIAHLFSRAYPTHVCKLMKGDHVRAAWLNRKLILNNVRCPINTDIHDWL